MPQHKSPHYATNRRYYEKNRERILERLSIQISGLPYFLSMMPQHKSPRYAANRRYYEKNRERILERRKQSRAHWKNLERLYPSTLPSLRDIFDSQPFGHGNDADIIRPYNGHY
ncbi:10333_t:CDS:2 [Cetraspora pellucida]|uniref:10333_t:CDS:1 n=1 Tax=Cetraspora pellucida TaxID=1433469 RepID=A0ACA9M8Z3_9GLOM|nr:10333_t:CDS:2 [Cetraspora pellucida]